MKVQRVTTHVISVSIPKNIVGKLEEVRKIRGQSRSAFISSLIDQSEQDERWQRIYKKGAETAQKFKITSEDDIDRILHEAKT